MKFNCGLSWAERKKLRADESAAYVERMYRWHYWFAWRPVRVGTHDCRWLEQVERRAVPAPHLLSEWIRYYKPVGTHLPHLILHP